MKNNIKTNVVSANKMGKDYTGGLICVGAFLNPAAFLLADGEPAPPLRSRDMPNVKIITTSVKDEHLDNLWGEMDRLLATAKYPLTADKGGPLNYLHREIRRVTRNGEQFDSFVKSQVSAKGEGLAGHHADYTLLVGDEASALDDKVLEFSQGWAKRFMFIGNPHQCTNFYFRDSEAGNLEMP